MKNDHVVIINGQAYDSVTGLPVLQTAVQPITKLRKNFQDIKSVSRITRPTQQATAQPQPKPVSMPKTGRLMDIAKSNSIAHFTKTHREIVEPLSMRHDVDIQHPKHPLVSKAELHRIKPAPKPVPKTSREIKEGAITEALNQPRVTQSKHRKKMSRRTKIVSIFAICLIILLGGGYMVYLFTPSLSVRFASAQAGVNAKYPEYVPDGYSADGPISFANRQVTINFKANAGDARFTITQSKSTWDSSALKDQIQTDSKGEFNTTTINGLTIYSYDSSAAWVNGGILYKISGDAHLLLAQIQRIATSL